MRAARAQRARLSTNDEKSRGSVPLASGHGDCFCWPCMSYDADLARRKFVAQKPNDIPRCQPEQLPTPGQVVGGKYRLERVLGVGGMGIVIAARHVQLEERVALKFVLPDHVRNAEVIARFMREARAAAKVQSDHVGRIYDVATLDDGTPYIVMEYLDGCDLAALLCAEGRLCVERAVDYLLQTCVAVSEAHRLGIVHRDLKPENLFLTRRFDGSVRIKVLDFGISKLVKSADGVNTTASTAMGSPTYMSPEQLRSSRDLDLRTDIWSLGVVLYELLTGRQPFIADSLEQLCNRVLEAAPPRLRDLLPDAPADLEEVLHRCLQKNPADRFGSVAELAAALRQFAPEHSRKYAAICENAASTQSVATALGQCAACCTKATKLHEDRDALVRRRAIKSSLRWRIAALLCVVAPLISLSVGGLWRRNRTPKLPLRANIDLQAGDSSRTAKQEPSVTRPDMPCPVMLKEEEEQEERKPPRYFPIRSSSRAAPAHPTPNGKYDVAPFDSGMPRVTAPRSVVPALPDDRK